MFSRFSFVLCFTGLCSLVACGGGATVGSGNVPSGNAPPAGSVTPSPGPGTTSIASVSPTPSAPSGAGASSATPSSSPAASAQLDLTCDNAPFPSTTFTQCEATNYSMVSEATTEQAEQPAFTAALASQGAANMSDWTARAAADPSWLSPLSGNTATTPLCTTWASPSCQGDPFRYADVAGHDGNSFYTNEAIVTPFVIYDSGCARMSGRVWAPKSSAPGSALPNIVMENGSVEAPEVLYWWAAQALVREGYVVMTFDPRGQGRSDEMTPTGGQGGNIDTSVFITGLVDAIDFFHSTPTKPYPNNATCLGTYSTTVTSYNPYWNRIDYPRLGIVGHSEGAIGVSVVQGLGVASPWTGKIDATNPVKVAVTWDGLLAPAGGDVGGIGSMSTSGDPKFVARVPAMGNSSEYGLTPTIFTSPPPIAEHEDGYKAWVAAGTPVFEFTIRGSSHYEWSLVPSFPATSWCPDAASGECTGGWGNPMAQYYTLAWFDRWLKQPGETGYADADARLLDDNGVQGRNKMSYHFASARSYPDRNGTPHVCANIRLGCADTGNGTNAKRRTVTRVR